MNNKIKVSGFVYSIDIFILVEPILDTTTIRFNTAFMPECILCGFILWSELNEDNQNILYHTENDTCINSNKAVILKESLFDIQKYIVSEITNDLQPC